MGTLRPPTEMGPPGTRLGSGRKSRQMANATNGDDLTDDSALSVIEALLKCFHVV